MKTAIIVIADPQSATEEAAARVSNALAFAEKGKRQGDRVKSRLLEPERLGPRSWPSSITLRTPSTIA